MHKKIINTSLGAFMFFSSLVQAAQIDKVELWTSGWLTESFEIYSTLSDISGFEIKTDGIFAYDLNHESVFFFNSQNGGGSSHNYWVTNVGLLYNNVNNVYTLNNVDIDFNDQYCTNLCNRLVITSIETAAIPEPETYTMFALGLLGLGLARKKV